VGFAGDHSLVQGLKGDATYLVVTDKSEIESFGINGAHHIASHHMTSCTQRIGASLERKNL
jgi:hypothetical protein